MFQSLIFILKLDPTLIRLAENKQKVFTRNKNETSFELQMSTEHCDIMNEQK